MDNKELEKKLEKSVEKIPVRDFSEVWEEIKDRVEPTKKNRFFRWTPVVATVAGLAVVCSIVIPIVINQNQPENPPKTYLESELLSEEVEIQEFLSQISSSELDLVNLSLYSLSSTYLLKTTDSIVKGGQMELVDNLDSPTFYLNIIFYHKTVQVNETQKIEYEVDYTTTNGAVTEYRLKDSYPEYQIYVYDIKANYNSVNYYMEYTCSTEDITPFLNSFFN